MNYYEVDTFEYDAQQYYEGKGYVSRKTYKPGEIGGNSGDVLFDIGYYDRYGFKFIFEGVTLRTSYELNNDEVLNTIKEILCYAVSDGLTPKDILGF